MGFGNVILPGQNVSRSLFLTKSERRGGSLAKWKVSKQVGSRSRSERTKRVQVEKGVAQQTLWSCDGRREPAFFSMVCPPEGSLSLSMPSIISCTACNMTKLRFYSFKWNTSGGVMHSVRHLKKQTKASDLISDKAAGCCLQFASECKKDHFSFGIWGRGRGSVYLL